MMCNDAWLPSVDLLMTFLHNNSKKVWWSPSYPWFHTSDHCYYTYLGWFYHILRCYAISVLQLFWENLELLHWVIQGYVHVFEVIHSQYVLLSIINSKVVIFVRCCVLTSLWHGGPCTTNPSGLLADLTPNWKFTCDVYLSLSPFILTHIYVYACE